MQMIKVLHLNYFKVGGPANVAIAYHKKLLDFGLESKIGYKSERSLFKDVFNL